MDNPAIETIMSSITDFKVDELPNSSFNVILGKRRSGKSVLAEYLIKQMVAKKKIDIVFLFSTTDAGFDIIPKEHRFKTIDKLHTLIENYRLINEYNKDEPKNKKIKIRTMCILDDMAVDLKSKSMNILESLSCNGRHLAYEPLSLHFCILSQSLTKIPRVVRLNCDNIFFNNIASSIELELILSENLYLLDSSIQGKRLARRIYNDLVVLEDFGFIVIENWRQNVKEYKDYIKTYKAILK
ncbi:MAG: hypothetical protein ACI9YE_000465 [Psychroserpens sp.]|jgi:hypothetical protein